MNLKKYTGCLKEIEISRTPYNILSSPDFVGLTKGCTLEVSLTLIYFGLNGHKCFLVYGRMILMYNVYSEKIQRSNLNIRTI